MEPFTLELTFDFAALAVDHTKFPYAKPKKPKTPPGRRCKLCHLPEDVQAHLANHAAIGKCTDYARCKYVPGHLEVLHEAEVLVTEYMKAKHTFTETRKQILEKQRAKKKMARAEEKEQQVACHEKKKFERAKIPLLVKSVKDKKEGHKAEVIVGRVVEMNTEISTFRTHSKNATLVTNICPNPAETSPDKKTAFEFPSPNVSCKKTNKKRKILLGKVTPVSKRIRTLQDSKGFKTVDPTQRLRVITQIHQLEKQREEIFNPLADFEASNCVLFRRNNVWESDTGKFTYIPATAGKKRNSDPGDYSLKLSNAHKLGLDWLD